MRAFLKKHLTAPVTRLANKYSSQPDKIRVHEALTALHNQICAQQNNKGPVLSIRDTDKFIIFSDLHKGAKSGSDDFARSEPNYLAALEYYNSNKFIYITLGDCEELWENTLEQIKVNNKPSFEKEKAFVQSNRLLKVFGNHDLFWDTDPFAALHLEKIYGSKLPVYEGVILEHGVGENKTQILLTHGHQGDRVSDGNIFSKWFVSYIWGPFQAYLGINPNTPAYDNNLKSKHNEMMYEWSAQQNNLILITGHTHQPVFQSLTFLERLYRQLTQAKEQNNPGLATEIEANIRSRQRLGETFPDFTAYQPSYFNSGCCCFEDGDITGLEIEAGMIRLVKWKKQQGHSVRVLLEETTLVNCVRSEKDI